MHGNRRDYQEFRIMSAGMLYAGCRKLEGGFVKEKAEVAAVKDSKTYGFFD